MIQGIEKTENLNKIAVVCVGYNRLKSLNRLLESLIAASYPHDDIPLVISIDCSGDQELYTFVNSFEWPFGEKYVNIQQERLGLLKHIYQCGDLTKYFKAIVLLEDDLFVSPYYYSYVENSVEKYANHPQIAQISLYKNERNGYVGLPFENEQNGSDVFLMQDVSTWGECWTDSMWKCFVEWRDTHSEDEVLHVDMPVAIKEWTRAWSKYYNAYVVDTGRFVLYPNVSLTTNFSDAGEHGNGHNSVVQVNLLQKDYEYRLNEYEDLVKYDIYFNNIALYDWLKLSPEKVCLDCYGFHDVRNDKQYILSQRQLSYKVEKSFALHMRPLELNVKYNIIGSGLYLYDTKLKASKPNASFSVTTTSYFLREYNPRMLLKYCGHILKKILLSKMKMS